MIKNTKDINYEELVECKYLNEIIEEFKAENIKIMELVV